MLQTKAVLRYATHPITYDDASNVLVKAGIVYAANACDDQAFLCAGDFAWLLRTTGP